MMIVSVGARVNDQVEGNMFERGKRGEQSSVPPSTLIFLHSCNYTLPPLTKRRNRGVIFFCFYTLNTLFHVIFGNNPRPGLLLC